MSTVLARIQADIAEAANVYPDVSNLVVDDECISFCIRGQEFTAYLQGEYGTSCDVFGPDDFEVSCQGSVVDIVATVCQKLQAAPSPQPLFRRGRSAETDRTSLDDESDFELMMDSDGVGCKDPLEGFEQLSADRQLVEAAGYGVSFDIVSSGQARVTVSMPIPSSISKSTAEVWGLNREEPLRMSVTLYHAHYSRTVKELEGLIFWQEKTTRGFEPMDAGVQLCSIAKTFWPRFCGAPVVDAPVEGAGAGAVVDRLRCKKDAILAEALSLPGVLLPLATYMMRRLPVLHEYCVICDEPLVFPPLLRPTVCTRSLCSYSARAFGTAVTGEFTGQSASLEVWDLLVSMALNARYMDEARMGVLFNQHHFPALFRAGSADPALKYGPEGLRKLKQLLSDLHEYRRKRVLTDGVYWLNQLFKDDGSVDALLVSLTSWVWDSNRSFILSLEKEDRIERLGTPFQYYLLSAPPELESAFQELKGKHGSEFCFHGSAAANWHCILRQGLKNASGTSLMTAGQAHGPGIYLARDSGTSAHYSSRGVPGGVSYAGRRSSQYDERNEVTGQRCHDPDALVMLAICEVAMVPQIKKVNNIWVCQEEKAVVTRFFLVYNSRSVPGLNLEDASIRQALVTLTRRWTSEEAVPRDGSREGEGGEVAKKRRAP